MQYSLLSRFRGGLLGCWMGGVLGFNPGQLTRFQTPFRSEVPRMSDGHQLAARGTECLIRWGRLEAEDWVQQGEGHESSLGLGKEIASSGEAAIALLPFILFYHDNLVVLRQQVKQGLALWHSEGQAFSAVWLVALAVVLALTEKLHPPTLIPQLLADLETAETPIVKQLEQVHLLLEQGADLETTVTQLRRDQPHQPSQGESTQTAIALAFYCFLHNPEDFHLAMIRAVRSGCYPQITAALTGALSGVYNSIMGIPVGWRARAGRITTAVQTQHRADELFAVWSGVCHPLETKRYPPAAVAAPGVIQVR